MIQVEGFGFKLTPRSTNMFRIATSQYGKCRHIATPTLSRCSPGGPEFVEQKQGLNFRLLQPQLGEYVSQTAQSQKAAAQGSDRGHRTGDGLLLG